MLSRGFTLLETTIAAFILAAGLTATAWVFAFSARTNINNHERTIALLLLHEKMEQFKATAPINNLHAALWTPGGSLDAASPTNGYFDNASVGGAGPYLRLWRIDGTTSRKLTVVIYVPRGEQANTFSELGRATTIVSP